MINEFPFYHIISYSLFIRGWVWSKGPPAHGCILFFISYVYWTKIYKKIYEMDNFGSLGYVIRSPINISC